MPHENLAPEYRTLGRVASWTTFALYVAYAVALTLGLLSLKSPFDPIGDPYFTAMELLILTIAPCLVAAVVAVHYYAPPERKAYSLAALAFMVVLAAQTSAVHFAVLTVSRQLEAMGLAEAPLLFSFRWPSVVYTVDILAWDVFFPLSMFFAAAVFRGSRLAGAVRKVMIVAGVLSVAGLIGVPLANMNYRNIGIVGYAVVAPVGFLLLGILFGRGQEGTSEARPKPS